MTATFENAKVGDRVFDYLFQEWGTVVAIYADKFRVRFNDKQWLDYYKSGKGNSSHTLQRLFWDEVKPIEAPHKPVSVPPVDTLVRVWDDHKGNAIPRYSAGKLNYMERIECWVGGATSKTTDFTSAWTHWELAEKWHLTESAGYAKHQNNWTGFVRTSRLAGTGLIRFPSNGQPVFRSQWGRTHWFTYGYAR